MNNNKAIKVTSIAMIMCFGYSNASYKAVIFPTKYIMAEKLTPKDWYGFLESDCVNGSNSSYPDLSSWENITTDPIICNGSSTSIPNMSDLTQLSTNINIGDASKFYNTENLLGLKGLNSSTKLSLYLQGEGVEFNQLKNAGNVEVNLNESGVKQINAKGVEGYQFQILGDTTNKSNVNEIILDNAMYGYNFSPALVKNIKNVNVKTTKDSLSSMAYIEDSYVNNAIIEKDADLNNLISDSKDNYAHYRFNNSTVQNIMLDKIDNIYLSHEYSKTRTEPDSFYKINSILIKDSYYTYVNLVNLKDLSRLEFRDSWAENSSFTMRSDGGDIDDGIYIFNDKDIRDPKSASFYVSGFNNINKIDFNDVKMSGSSLNFAANNEIKTVNLNNFSSSYLELKATKVGSFTSTMTDMTPMDSSSYYFKTAIGDATFNHAYIPYISIDYSVDALTFNGLRANSMITAKGDVGSLIVNSATTLDNFQINFYGNISHLEINDNDPANNVSNVVMQFDSTKVLDHNVFKTLTTGQIYMKNNFAGDFDQPFTNKFSNSDPFCVNYGISTKLSMSSHPGELVPKSSICN